MITITKNQLIELSACQDGISWFVKSKKRSLNSVIYALLKDNKFDYARWLLPRLMTRAQKVLWAVQSAELVIDVFENKYPNDKRPRKAIQAAKDFLAGKFTADAADAAADAADAAAGAAYAAGAAAYAAYATYAVAAAYAAYATYAAAAADAADAAAVAAAYAAAGSAYTAVINKNKIQQIICENALRILGEVN